jgi:hypothetical protein
MNTTQATDPVGAQQELLDHDLRLLHGLSSEVDAALVGASLELHLEWRHLQHLNMGVFSELDPSSVDEDELGLALKRLRAFKDRLLAAHPHVGVR